MALVAEDALVDFEWESAGPGGYRWVRASRSQLPGKRALVTVAPGRDLPSRFDFLGQPFELITRVQEVGVKRYEPFRQETGLFRIFAGTKPTKTGIMEFAERYGLLGERLFFFDQKGGQMVWGEGLRDDQKVHGWASEIQLVKDTLRRFGRWSTAAGGHGVRDDGRRIINRRLEELVSPRLDWAQDAENLRLSYVPKNLLGAIWIQLALSLGHDKRYPLCQKCERPFEVSLDRQTGQRADSMFCSDRCKSADYRDRKKDARRLSKQKMSPSKIAKKVRSDTATVKRWLSQGNRRR